MTPQEIEAKAEEIRLRLQALAGKKVGWGMDGVFRQVLQGAFDLVGLVKELAKLAGRAPGQSEDSGASS
jgi:hypothetical protein